MLNLLLQHRAELSRALANHHYERMPDGRILFTTSGLIAGGVFRTSLNGIEQIDPNTWVYQGLDDLLKVYFKQQAQQTAFYIAPFSDAEAPAQSLTAATFAGTLTEFTNYSESARQAWTPGAEASQSVTNGAAPAVFSAAAGGGVINGAGLIAGASAKSSTSGILICAAQFAAPRTLVGPPDKLTIEYDMTAIDGSA